MGSNSAQPPPEGALRHKRTPELTHIRNAALGAYVIAFYIALAVGLAAQQSPMHAMASALASPFLLLPAVGVVGTVIVAAQRSRHYVRCQERAYRIKLSALNRVLFDIHAPLEIRERAAYALARMDERDAVQQLHEAIGLPPFNDSDENRLRYYDAIGKALLIARGPTLPMLERLAVGEVNEHRDIRVQARGAAEALRQLDERRRHRRELGHPTHAIKVDAADAEIVLSAIRTLQGHSTAKSQVLDRELLGAAVDDDDVARMARGGVQWSD